jgi:hypothetical protein
LEFEIEHPNEVGDLSLLDFKLNVNGIHPKISPFTKNIKTDIFVSKNTAMPSKKLATYL